MTGETDLRDALAVTRTHLANERTLLAYVRTALALIATGAGLIEFLDSPTAHLIGAVFIIGGGVLVPLGTMRFIHVRRSLRGE